MVMPLISDIFRRIWARSELFAFTVSSPFFRVTVAGCADASEGFGAFSGFFSGALVHRLRAIRDPRAAGWTDCVAMGTGELPDAGPEACIASAKPSKEPNKARQNI